MAGRRTRKGGKRFFQTVGRIVVVSDKPLTGFETLQSLGKKAGKGKWICYLGLGLSKEMPRIEAAEAFGREKEALANRKRIERETRWPNSTRPT
jgi:hypothetical protein